MILTIITLRTDNSGAGVLNHKEQLEGYVLLDFLSSPETQKEKKGY